MSNGSGLFGNQGPKKPHLVVGKTGVAGEVTDLRSDLAGDLGALAAFTVDEWTNAAAADVDAIKASFASSASAEDFSGADLDGVVGVAEMVPPRNVTFTTSVHADIDAVAVVITGTDINGAALTETVTLTDGGGTDVGAKAFSTVSRIEIPAQAGAGGAVEIGFGVLLGLGKPLLARAGAEAVLMENAAGTMLAADAITGTFVAAASSAPNGTYSPSAAPNGTNDYAVWYEFAPPS